MRRRGRGLLTVVDRDLHLLIGSTRFAVMLEFAYRVADRSPPAKSTLTASALHLLSTLSVIAFTSSLE